ncbi:MAG: branched-chain amino acid transaminase [SAR202 cluster bacterium]|nr:branched-chain amino acid transaminase [SAR202 cluster bacterium]
MAEFKYLIFDGDIVPYEDAKLHISTPAVRYGATAFEGIRAYWNSNVGQLFMFRARDHMDRLLQSAWLMGMEGIKYSSEELISMVTELLRRNSVRHDVHIRPSLFVASEGSISSRGPVCFGVVLASGNPALSNHEGVNGSMRLAISSWRRIDDNTVPPRIKAAANYQNGRMALIQAEKDGYDGAIMLNAAGKVTEEPRACIFLIRDGKIITPSITNDILESITRDSVIQLLKEAHSIQVVERAVDRTELYLADEIFLVGTALEITAVRSVDQFEIGGRSCESVTSAISETYVAAVSSNEGLHSEWREPVYDI